MCCTRLIFNRHEGPSDGPLADAEALLAALAGLPRLRLLETVPGDEGLSVTPIMLHVLMQLGRRLPPHVRLGQQPDTYLGWTLPQAEEVAAEEAAAAAAAGVSS